MQAEKEETKDQPEIKSEEAPKKEAPSQTVPKSFEISPNSESESIKIIKKGNDNSQLNISYNFLFKVSLIGDSGTGKTSILTRFIDNVFKDDTATTIGVDFKIVSFDLGDSTYAKMQIFLKTCSAFVLVFDLTRAGTFTSIDNWIKTINENTKPKFLILIGNKSDMVNERQVSKEDILKYCEKNNLNYIEISAKNNENVEKIFKEVAYQLYSEIKSKKINEDQGAMKEFEIGGYKNIKIGNGKKESKEPTKKCCNI